MKVRRHRKKRQSKAVSIDVGWSRTNWKRTAIAWSHHKTGRVKVDLLDQNEWLEDWVRELVMPEGLVAINIPIQGCEQLAENESFRCVDRGLIKVGIPLLPSASAGNFGSEIADRIRAAVPDCQVVEVYPYGVLRFLWSLRFVSDVRPVKMIDGDDWEEYLNARAWKRNPPRYKRARKRLDMIRAMKNAITVLDGSHYGRAFDELCDDPLSLMTRSELLRMSDAFDVLLGLVALDRHVRRSPFARIFSVPGKQGEILGLGDSWLWKKWSTAVRDLAG